MSTTRLPYLFALSCAALLLAGCGGNVVTSTGAGGSGATGPDDACTTADDCTWGEIDHEILQVSDCVCLLGCPYLPQSKETVDRRSAQYKSLCTPGQDGQGNPCPIDDCAIPPPLQCVSGKCVAPQQ